MRSRQIAIITDEPGWHGAQLRKAFATHGHACRFVSLTDCGFDLKSSRFGVCVPGFQRQLPAGVFVRGVPGGSLEQVVLYLDVLHALRELGVVVYNDAHAIERTVDKAMTSFLLRRAGVPTPPTWVTSDPRRLRELLVRELASGHELVLKPLFGSQGVGLRRINNPDALTELEHCNGVFYAQRFIDRGKDNWHDWRVFVIGGHAVAAMRRTGSSWISNVANGARCQPAVLDEALRDLAERAVKVIGINYAGVDILRDREGHMRVVEVNSIPAWKGLQGTCNCVIAELLVDDFLGACDQHGCMEIAG
jgi:RimK family alpha-L-glutamate ligase